MAGYAHPEILVDTQSVADHLNDPHVRLVELHYNQEEYDRGHIPGAVFWNVLSRIVQADKEYRTNYDRTAFEQLMMQSGIGNETLIIFYGLNLAYSAWAVWYTQVFGHANARVMNGGRKQWIAEARPLVTDNPTVPPAHYVAKEPTTLLWVTREQVQAALDKPDTIFVDARSTAEYQGELFWGNPPQENEQAGHIPGAVHVNYEMTFQEDGTFKPADELRALYAAEGVTGDKEIIPYCTFGARTAQTWFVLKYLLGYEKVCGYFAGWYEWGRTANIPVEK